MANKRTKQGRIGFPVVLIISPERSVSSRLEWVPFTLQEIRLRVIRHARRAFAQVSDSDGANRFMQIEGSSVRLGGSNGGIVSIGKSSRSLSLVSRGLNAHSFGSTYFYSVTI